MDFILMFVGVVVLVAVVVYFIMQNNKKITASSWAGTVESKKVHSNNDGPDGFSVSFKTDADETVKVSVKKAQYDDLQIGDSVIKKAGERYPTKSA